MESEYKYDNVYKDELAMTEIANKLQYKSIYCKRKSAVIADLWVYLWHFADRFSDEEYEEIYNKISEEC